MSLATTVLKALQRGGTFSNISAGAMSVGGRFLRQAKNVLLSPWGKFSSGSDADSMIRLAKIGGGSLLGIWGASNGLRSYEESRAAFHNSGNREGSAVYSALQATLYAGSAVAPVLAMLAPGPIGALVRNVPALATIPGALALGMDHFQGLATADEKHPMAKIAQVGMGNWLINMKSKDQSVMMTRSKLLPWWCRNVRSLDEKVMHGLGFKEFERTNYSFAA